jgi:hypothetical protein
MLSNYRIYIALNERLMKGKLQRMWNDAIVADFIVFS